MTYRIEITFAGDAPDNELERAKIMAGDNVTAAIEGLTEALLAAGLKHEIRVRAIRELGKRGPRKPREPQMRVQGAQAAE